MPSASPAIRSCISCPLCRAVPSDPTVPAVRNRTTLAPPTTANYLATAQWSLSLSRSIAPSVLLIRNVVGVCRDSLFEACYELIRQTVEMLKTT